MMVPLLPLKRPPGGIGGEDCVSGGDMEGLHAGRQRPGGGRARAGGQGAAPRSWPLVSSRFDAAGGSAAEPIWAETVAVKVTGVP